MTITDIDKQVETWFKTQLGTAGDEQKLKNLVNQIVDQAKAEQREEILKKITPALEDFSAAANLMIKDGFLKKTGQEIHENIGYIKSCFMSDDIAKAIRDTR